MFTPHKSLALSLTIRWLWVLHTCRRQPMRVKHQGNSRRYPRRGNKLDDIEAYAAEIVSRAGEVRY